MTETFDDFNQTLDLEPIKVSLTQREDGPGWPLEKVEELELWYRRYLYMVRLYPEKIIVPTREIDTFWHYHILDTLKYMEDCEALFGRYVHHFPYFGMRGEEDRQNLQAAFAETEALFIKHFDESPLVAESADCGALCNEPGPDPKPFASIIKTGIRPTLVMTGRVH